MAAIAIPIKSPEVEEGVLKVMPGPSVNGPVINWLKTEQSVAGVARELGLIQQTLQNWVKLASKGALKDAKNRGVIGSDIPLSASVPTVSVWT